MVGSAIFTTVILALMAKDGVHSCSIRAHKSGTSQPSTADSTTMSDHISSANGLTQYHDTLNTVAINPATYSQQYDTPVAPLFNTEPTAVRPVTIISYPDQNEILMQLQRLVTPADGPLPPQPEFSSPFPIYGPPSYVPGHAKHTLQQQYDPESFSSNVETIDTELRDRIIIPSLLSSPAFRDYITESKAVPVTGAIVTPAADITTFNSNAPTVPTVGPISVSTSESNFTLTPNNASSVHSTSTPSSQSSTLSCLECNSTSIH